MSDALTDIARDERRAEVSERILELEMKFLDDNINIAEVGKLIQLWEEYRSIGRGYWGMSSQKLASRRIEKYKSFLANGEVSFSIREEA